MERSSGILYPIFSLPSSFGIGCFSKEAREFIDFLEKAGQSYWQILPLGPTGFGDSPYQPVSAFAGNPYFIDPVQLIEEGLLTWDDVNALEWGDDPAKVDYDKLYHNRQVILKKALETFDLSDQDYLKFVRDNAEWLEDFALFMSLKKAFKGKSWLDWEAPYKERDPKTLAKAGKDLKDSIDLYCFEQYAFDKQWKSLKEYAHEHHIEIIGDMPFYTSMDSSDSWAHPEVFRFEKDGTPVEVAGCAPDAFAPKGQLWGNPVYDWKALKKDHYAWWINRVKRNLDLFDIIRIDHFEGFVTYYAIPYGKSADLGTSEKGPGMELFEALFKKLGKVPMIAEDLGSFNPDMKKLLKDTGIPGMNVLEYAFTSWNSTYLPYKNIPDSVIYTGTHDNPPVREWLEELNEGSLNYLKRFMNTNDGDYGALTWDFLREAYRSPSNLCIIPIQDYFTFGKEARLNTPGTSQGNWQWRVVPNFLSDDLAYSIRGLCETYGRIVDRK